MTTIYNSPNCGTNRKYVFRPMKCRTFKFTVKAGSNVNLCLSPNPTETPHQQFEVFLGGWGGGESAIRRNKSDDVCKVKTPDVLNKNQFRGFWVVVTNHAIKIGKANQSTPFLIHTDPTIKMNLSYYGYCTAYGSTGQWTFDDDDLLGQGFDMGSMGAAISEISKPPLGGYNPQPPAVGFNPPTHGIYPPAPPPPYSPPITSTGNGSIHWVPCKSVSTCPAPVQAAPGASGPYVAVAYHNGGLIPGVVMPPNFNVCHIPWGGQAVAKMDFFLLSNPGNVEVVWQAARNGTVPVGALQGGYSETGEPLYIGRFKNSGNYISGKVHPSHRVCYVPYWGAETSNATYDVLCLKTVPLSFLGIQ